MATKYEGLIAKIEEHLGTPGCVCGDRREAMVILSEFHGQATHEELEAFHRRANWECPLHGQSHARIAMRLRLSSDGFRQAALTYRPEELHGY